MEGILKVTPEKLIQTSGEFSGVGTQIKNLTSEMMEQVQSMKSIWQGEAASAYGFSPCKMTWTGFIGWCRNMSMTCRRWQPTIRRLRQEVPSREQD